MRKIPNSVGKKAGFFFHHCMKIQRSYFLQMLIKNINNQFLFSIAMSQKYQSTALHALKPGQNVKKLTSFWVRTQKFQLEVQGTVS